MANKNAPGALTGAVKYLGRKGAFGTIGDSLVLTFDVTKASVPISNSSQSLPKTEGNG